MMQNCLHFYSRMKTKNTSHICRVISSEHLSCYKQTYKSSRRQTLCKSLQEYQWYVCCKWTPTSCVTVRMSLLQVYNSFRNDHDVRDLVAGYLQGNLETIDWVEPEGHGQGHRHRSGGG